MGPATATLTQALVEGFRKKVELIYRDAVQTEEIRLRLERNERAEADDDDDFMAFFS